MSQEAQDGPPPPFGPNEQEGDAAATPLLGSPYPNQPAPAVEFGPPQPPADATKPLPVSSSTVRDAPKVQAETVQDIPLPPQQREAQQVPVQQPVARAQPAADDQATQQFTPLPQTSYQAPPAQHQPPPQAQYQAPPQQTPQAHPVQPYQTPIPQQYQTPPPTPAPPAAPARPSWHRHHYTVGVFLVVYGLTNLATGLLGFSNHKRELAGYIGEGMAGQALVAIKALEGLLLLLTIAGLARKRDVWFLPSLLGWVAGFAAFCVLDVVKGKYGPLAEHAVYAILFFVVLVVSHGLSAKARKERPAPVAAPQDPSQPGLSRTQEIALNALNRWQRQQ